MREAPVESSTLPVVHYRDWGDGALVIEPEGRVVSTTERQRAVLDALAQSVGGEASAERVIDLVWGDDAPRSARASLHNLVSRLRTAGGDGAIQTTSRGYRLTALRSEDVVRSHLHRAEAAVTEGELEHALLECAAAALILTAAPPGAVRDRLRRIETTVRLRSLFALNRYGSVIEEGLTLLEQMPTDEGLGVIVVDALVAAGRRGEALGVIARIRRAMRIEHGLGLSAVMRRRERHILDDDQRHAPPRDVLPLVGRESSIALAHAALRGGKMIRVTAEPGGGVTRFLNELRRTLLADPSENWRVALVTCDNNADTALAVLDDVLHELGVETDSLGGVISSFAAAVDNVAASSPLVVLVDDAQYCGPSTRERLLDVAATNPRVLLVWGGHGPALAEATVDITLEPLTRDEIVESVKRARLEIDADLVARLSGGNPQLATLIVAQSQGEIDSSANDSVELLSLSQAVISPLLGRLTSESRELVELVAIAGGDIDHELLGQCVKIHEATPKPALPDELVEVRGDVVHLRHGLAAEFIVRDLAPGRRAELHFVIASTAERLGMSPRLIAIHARESSLDRSLTARAAIAAGRAASNEGAHRDAVDWYALAVQQAGDDRERHECMIELGNAQRLAGMPDHIETLITACEWCQRVGERELLGRAAWALLQLGATTSVSSVDSRVSPIIEAVLADITDPSVFAPVAAAASLALSLTGDSHRARELFEQAESVSVVPAGAGGRERETRRRVLRFAYLSLGVPPQWERRDRLTSELLALAIDDDDADAGFEAQHLRFSSGIHRADGYQVRGALTEMNSLIAQTGDVGHRWELLYCGSAMAQLENQPEKSIRLSEQAYRLFRVVSPARAEAAHASQLFATTIFGEGPRGMLGDIEQLVSHQGDVPAWNAALALALATSTEASAADRHSARDAAKRALATDLDDFTSLTLHTLVGRTAIALDDADLADSVRGLLEPWHDRVAWQGTCAFGTVAAVLSGLAALTSDHVGARKYRDTHATLVRRLNAPGIARDPALSRL